MASTDNKILDGAGLVELVKKIKGSDSALAARITTLEETSHTHSNQDLLDTYTQTEESLADAVGKKHEHSNKSVLDGITSAKVTGWDNAANARHTHANQAELDKIAAGDKAKWDAKQDALTAEQVSAVDSGITSDKVGAYDGHLSDSAVHITAAERTKWDGKQDKLTNTDAQLQDAVTKAHSHTTAQTNAMNSGITKTKVSGYDSHLSDTTVHITAAERTKWDGKQDKLTNTDTQIQDAVSKAHAHSNATVLDGISADKVSSWDSAASASHSHANKALLDTYDQTNANLKDAVSKKHSHTTAQTNAMDSGITSAKVAAYDTALTYISPAATKDNYLVDKAYVDNQVERLEARNISSNTAGEPFASHAALTGAKSYYYNGVTVKPDTNDIAVVLADEDHAGDTGELPTTRYRWVGDPDTGSWAFDYVINTTALTTDQLAAVNSGITTSKVEGYDSHLGNTTVHITAAERTKWNGKQDALSFDGTYNKSTNKVATVSTVTTAIGKLDGAVTGTPGAGKTLTAFSETDGVVSATFNDIAITKSQVTDFPDSLPPTEHTHGFLNNIGVLTNSSTTLQSNYVIAVAQGNGTLMKSGIAFDAHTTTTALTPNGTWEEFAKPGDVSSAIEGLDGVITGTPGAGKTLTAFSETGGVVTATFGNISITKSQISDFPTSMTPTSHAHGNITNGGTITADTTLEKDDQLVITDANGSSKVARSPIKFDATTTTKALTPKGTWESFATAADITTAIQGLDGSITGTPGAGKTLTAFSETDGVVTATFGDISITKSQISDFPTSMTPASHSHGNITNTGTLQSTGVDVANGDYLVVTDASNSAKVAKTKTMFDGSTTNTALTPKGTFEAFAKAGDITTAIQGLDGVITGTPGAGQTLTAFSETDGVVTATFGDISITKSQISDFPTSMTPASHSHGNITNTGTLQSTGVDVANGDYLVVTDASNSSKVAKTKTMFDGSTTNTALTPKGTFEAFAKAADITTAIQGLDGSITGTPGAGKTLTAFSETDGVVTATFGDISITKSQISDFPTSMTPTSHAHGNITNDGKLQTDDITIASGDKLIVTDASNSSKVARASISFNGTTTTKALSQKGTWETFATAADITTAIQALDGSVTGTPGAGKTLTAFSETDGKVTATFGNISITKSQVSDFPSTMTPSAHTHGFLDNAGVLTNESTTLVSNYVIAIAQGNGTLMKSGIAFDCETTNTALTPNGTWERFLQSSDLAGKADKVSGATAGDIATLDANGNLVDSGKKPGDYVPVASVKLDQVNTTILAQIQALQAANIDYKRFVVTTDGYSSTISDKPTGTTNAGFVLEAYRNRNVSASDWRYRLICWVQADNNPYVAVVTQATTAISWSRLNTNTDTKVTETLVSDNAEYPLLLTPKGQTATTTTTATFDSGVTLNPSTNTITANITGSAGSATNDGAGNSITGTYLKKGDPTFTLAKESATFNNGSANGQNVLAVVGTTDNACKAGMVTMYGPSIGAATSTNSTGTLAGIHQYTNNNYLRLDAESQTAPSGYKFSQGTATNDAKTIQTASLKTNFTGGLQKGGKDVATEEYVGTEIGKLDATVTSTDGKNVQVKVTEADGKVTAVNITTDNTAGKDHEHPRLVAELIDSKTDLNTLTPDAEGKIKTYYWAASAGPANLPTACASKGGMLTMYQTSGTTYGVQEVRVGSQNYGYFVRHLVNGTWDAWKTVYYEATSTYSSTGAQQVNGTAVAAALATLDATATSTDGKNVQVKVTETDGKVTAVNITTDNTQSTGNLVTSWSSTTSDTKYPSEKLVKTALDGKQGTLTFDGTYNASTNKAATVSTVTNAINALDVTAKTGTTLQTITSISETDGKISATFSNIATMGGASASAAGTEGLVPAPAKGNEGKFLRGDGTWAAPANTDTLVTQSVTTTANFRPIVLGYQNDGTHTTLSNTITQQVYATNILYAQPSTGMIAATSFKVAEKASFVYNSADNAIDLVW